MSPFYASCLGAARGPGERPPLLRAHNKCLRRAHHGSCLATKNRQALPAVLLRRPRTTTNLRSRIQKDPSSIDHAHEDFHRPDLLKSTGSFATVHGRRLRRNITADFPIRTASRPACRPSPSPFEPPAFYRGGGVAFGTKVAVWHGSYLRCCRSSSSHRAASRRSVMTQRTTSQTTTAGSAAAHGSAHCVILRLLALPNRVPASGCSE
jgi:hypothetical protein